MSQKKISDLDDVQAIKTTDKILVSQKNDDNDWISKNLEVSKLDARYVSVVDNETISGQKTFEKDIIVEKSIDTSCLRNRFSNLDVNTNPDATKSSEFRLEDKNQNPVVSIISKITDGGNRQIVFSTMLQNKTNKNIASFTASADGTDLYAKGTALASVGMPNSTGFSDISLPFHGNYIAFSYGVTQSPKNGWISIYATSQTGKYIQFVCANSDNVAIYTSNFSPDATGTIEGTFPITKGMKVLVYHTIAMGQNDFLRFIEANAEF